MKFEFGDILKSVPYLLIAALGGWLIITKIQMDGLESKLVAESTVSNSLKNTVDSLKAAQDKTSESIRLMQDNYKFVVEKLQTNEQKATAAKTAVKEIKDARKDLGNDSVGDAMLYSLEQLRRLHEATYGSGQGN